MAVQELFLKPFDDFESPQQAERMARFYACTVTDVQKTTRDAVVVTLQPLTQALRRCSPSGTASI